jgi:DNA repair protein RecN (Recombination protein N)
MLVRLTVENYALIDKLDISFDNGLTIITGETGAGKSILLGALSLILGQRADTQVLLDKERKCIVEGEFNIRDYEFESFFKDNDLDPEPSVIVRREISPSGKSRAFINDTPVNLNVLKDLSERLIDIHSQHRTLEINDAAFQVSVIDSFAQQQQQIKSYQEQFRKYRELNKNLADLKERQIKFQTDQDYYQFQFDELEQAQLVIGEQEELEAELNILNNAESIRENLIKSADSLSETDENILSKLVAVQQMLVQAAKYDQRLAELADRMNILNVEIKELSREISQHAAKVLIDPTRTEIVSNRLDLIYRLIQKHHVASITELIAIKEKLDERLLQKSSLDNEIIAAQKQFDDLGNRLEKLSSEISASRKKIIPSAENKLKDLLKSLGMPDARISVECLPTEQFGIRGKDNIRFLFNANKGGELKELSDIASGGELSRLMLAVKSLISQKNLLPTIIFDEIDSGVSGEIAGKVGQILVDLGKQMQVIAITHLPQIAARGNQHLYVFKKTVGNYTHTFIRGLNAEERIKEIAQMIGGKDLTENTLETARELLSRN